MLYSLFFIFYFFTNTVEKFMINKSLISKNSFYIQNKYDDYNSKPNSSILQNLYIISIIIFVITFKFCIEPRKHF